MNGKEGELDKWNEYGCPGYGAFLFGDDQQVLYRTAGLGEDVNATVKNLGAFHVW